MTASGTLRTIGVVLMGVWGAVATLFVAGEAFTDPGGAAAWGMTAAWVVPMLALAWLAWRDPEPLATRVLAGAVGLVCLGWVAYVAFPGWWRDVFDRFGPVLAVAGLAATVPLGALGRRRPAVAGWLLVVAAAVPWLALLLAEGSAGVGRSATIASIPDLLVGGCFLLAASFERGGGGATR